jgi:RNA polymerase sigma factor FliA
MSTAAASTALRLTLKPARASEAFRRHAARPANQRLRAVKSQALVETASAPKAVEDFSRRDELILQHLPLVTAIALRVHDSLPVHVDVDDLVHAGVMGLFDAATKYETNKMVAFPAYAKHRIKGAILDSLRQLDCASRDLRRRLKQLEAATQELTERLNRAPSINELADHMEMSLNRLRSLMVDLRNLGLLAAQSRSNAESESCPAQEVPCKVEQHPDRVFARDELRARLETAIETLPVRYRQVVRLYYDRDMTMKEIGGILGVNESRVSQIHKSALARMQSALASSGIQPIAMF